MTVNFSSSMVGLSLLTGSNAFASGIGGGIAFESRAVRLAKAQFTMEATTPPPWKDEADSRPLSAQASAIKAMKTIIDKAGTGTDLLPDDVQTSFTAYKALDRLRVLAEAASATTASDAQRKSLQTSFAKGLAEVKSFLAGAPSDQVTLAFHQPARNAKTIGIPAPDQYAVKGPGLVDRRSDPIPGLTGQEKFELTLSKPGSTDKVTVDLSAGPQPPTLDSVTDAINVAITSVPLRNADGSVRLDENGNPTPRYLVRFVPDKGTDKWGFKMNAPSGIEEVTLDEIGAKDALVVATGRTPLDAPTATTVFRLDDPAGAADKKTMAEIAALDRQQSERNKLLDKTVSETKIVYAADGTPEIGKDGKVKLETTKTSDVQASTSAAAIATDAQGNSYIVGTTAGDLGANRSDGDDNLFLTKLDGEGKVVWQRSLGAGGSSEGAAIAIGADGSVTVAGTVNGSFDGATTDGDMLVAKFDASGDEQFASVVRNAGADSARAVAVGADGTVFVGGRTASGGGDAYLARIDSEGRVVERRTIAEGGSESVTALAVDGEGNLLALTGHAGNATLRKIDGASLGNDLARIDLGTADARALAVAEDGSIAVGGVASQALSGTQVNAMGGGRDGFVARIDAGLSGASVTYLATDKDDQVDSLTFMNGDLYAGGRTSGDMGATRRGPVDGFVARIDAASGAVQSTNQFGQALLRTEPVRIAAAAGGASSLGALGFARGTVNPPASDKLVSQTALRPGDSFSLRVNGGATRKVTIEADDTLETLADRVRAITGSRAKITTPRVSGERSLRIDVKEGNGIDLIAGPGDSDALAKLGIDAQRIATPLKTPDNAPSVRPGGAFGLSLTDALNVSTLDDAKVALKKMKEAVSMSQTAYRSLFWDDGKATLVDGAKNSAFGKFSTAREQSQLANYQAALNRLSTPNTSLGF